MLTLHTQVDRRTNVYLASPYRGTREEIEARMRDVSEVFQTLRNAGHFVTSPMLHHYTFADSVEATNNDYWLDYSQHVITCFGLWNQEFKHPEMQSEVWLLDSPGFRESSGVKRELETAWEWNLTVRLFTINMGGLHERCVLRKFEDLDLYQDRL